MTATPRNLVSSGVAAPTVRGGSHPRPAPLVPAAAARGNGSALSPLMLGHPGELGAIRLLPALNEPSAPVPAYDRAYDDGSGALLDAVPGVEPPPLWAVALAVPLVAAVALALALWSGVLGSSWRPVTTAPDPTAGQDRAVAQQQLAPGRGLGLRGAPLTAGG
ncbi:MAG: hypothetical protein U0Q15_08005 [Kineosporiaceae bacterium]